MHLYAQQLEFWDPCQIFLCLFFSHAFLLLLCHTSVYSPPAPLQDLCTALLIFNQPNHTYIFLLFPFFFHFTVHIPRAIPHPVFSINAKMCQNVIQPLSRPTICTTTAVELKWHKNAKNMKVKDLFSACCLLHCKYNKINYGDNAVCTWDVKTPDFHISPISLVKTSVLEWITV